MNVMDVETVEPVFCIAASLPSVAETMVVAVGGCTGVDVVITETVSESKLATYISLLLGLRRKLLSNHCF
jgi:hypothetical protein